MLPPKETVNTSISSKNRLAWLSKIVLSKKNVFTKEKNRLLFAFQSCNFQQEGKKVLENPLLALDHESKYPLQNLVPPCPSNVTAPVLCAKAFYNLGNQKLTFWGFFWTLLRYLGTFQVGNYVDNGEVISENNAAIAL